LVYGYDNITTSKQNDKKGIKMKTYEITTPNGNQYVCASSRSVAVYKATGLKEKTAKEAGMILNVKICK